MISNLSIQIYAQYNGLLLYDFSALARGLIITTNKHGFGDCSFFVPLSLDRSFSIYDRTAPLHVGVYDGASVVWEGRLEDVSIVAGGVRLRAYGYMRAFSDSIMLEAWSTTNLKDFVMEPETIANSAPQKYAIDNGANNKGTERIFLGLVKNTVYGNNTDGASCYYIIPYGDIRPINYLKLDYNYILPTNWTFRAFACDGDFTSNFVSNNITTVGGTASGTLTWDLSATPRFVVGFQIFNSTGSNYTMSGETGSMKASVSNIRVTTGGATITADDIIKYRISQFAGFNPTQISALTDQIESPGIDLTDISYYNRQTIDAFDEISKWGDNATPPSEWGWGIWEGQRVHFCKRGKYGRAWYIDAYTLDVERTIDTLVNGVSVAYTTPSGSNINTLFQFDSDSVSRYGIKRYRMIPINTTDSTVATNYRAAALNDSKDPSPRIGITFSKLYDDAGGLWPLWTCRSGDTITIRNLPPTLSTSIDRIRTFRISETSYDVDNNILTITPELPQNRVDVMLARLQQKIPQ